GQTDDPVTLTQTASDAAALREYAERASASRWPVAAPTSPRKLLRGLYSGAALIVLIRASLLFPSVRQSAFAVLRRCASAQHIAVLPFDNIGNDAANEAIAQGLMDSLTSDLPNLDAAQESLWVVPSNVVRSRKISDPSAAERELGATLVVKGSMQRQGEDVQ